MHRKLISLIIVILIFSLTLVATGCSNLNPVPQITPSATLSPTPIPTPSSTPEPLAAKVNEDGVLMADYSVELQNYQKALSITNNSSTGQPSNDAVINYLIDQTLLAQSARKNGVNISDTVLNDRKGKLIEKMGGQQAYDNWLSMLGYSDSSFLLSLKRSIEAQEQEKIISAAIPEKMLQIHARQLLLLDEGLANQVYQHLQTGSDFSSLASYYDPVTSGELGWIPKGYLFYPEIESAIFSLQPPQYTPVIKTEAGYHIVQVLEVDSEHPLTSETRRILEQKAISEWLTSQRATASIEIYIK